MGRPNRDMVSVSVFLKRNGVEACKQLAEKRGVPVSEIYRDVFRAGFPIVAADAPSTQ